MIDVGIPDIETFNPYVIPFQGQVMDDIFCNFDFANGTHEMLLSGSVGSAKTILMAHIACKLSLMFPRNRVLLCRKTLPALKETLLSTLVEHFGQDKISYNFNRSRGRVYLPNGSEILCHSWADKKYKKVRSFNISSAFVEEGTENENDEFYKEIVMRCGRLQHIPISICIMATNPDSPSHWIYEHFINKQSETRRVYYSQTADNPFLPPQYIERLKQNLTEKEAQRMLYGKWIEITKEVVYYNYDKERNFRNESKEINPAAPLDLMFDFNIGFGKPMSMAIGQHYGDHFHVLKTVLVDGARTGDIMDEVINSGYLDHKQCNWVRVFGDASGKNKDTRNNKSDYDIIKKALENYTRPDGTRLRVDMKVPSRNPELRSRHNTANAKFQNANGLVQLTIYKDAEDADKGFRLTKYKKGATLIEDDTLREQHVTTAVTYWIHHVTHIKPAAAASSD